MFKKCKRCFLEKTSSSYRKSKATKDGLKSVCKDCLKVEDLQYRKSESGRAARKKWAESGKGVEGKRMHYEANKETVLLKNKQWRQENIIRVKEYRIKNAHTTKEYNKRRFLENKSYWAERRKERYKKDKDFKIKVLLANRLYSALKRKNGGKNGSSIVKYLGCTIPEFKIHIEGQFEQWMTWDNIGEWHIDHIIPLDLFCLHREACRYSAFHYSNMRPLKRFENISKSNKYIKSTTYYV